MLTADDYDKMSPEQRAAYKLDAFNKQAGGGLYATSRDFNLRELEIGFILESIPKRDGLRIADLGCGNGYTTLRIASKIDADITGFDFASALIEEAKQLADGFKLRRAPKFEVADITTMTTPKEPFDVIVTERVLLNMTSIEAQAAMLKRLHSMLAPDGLYIMIEGNRDGLRRLNDLRQRTGLGIIQDRGPDNVGSLKFEENDFDQMAVGIFETIKQTNFGTYFLVSRVIHPLLVAPHEPTFDHKINEIARLIQTACPDLLDIGHLMGRVLRKR